MYFSDTATSLMRVEARPNLGRQISHNTALSNSLREGLVVRTAPLENFEMTLFIYVYTIQETVKAEAPAMPNASAMSSTGSYSPYLVGDKVLVAFLHGDATRTIVVAKIHDLTGISEYMLQPGNPVPPMLSKTPSGETVRPSPPTLNVEAFQEGGYLTYTAYPMFLID